VIILVAILILILLGLARRLQKDDYQLLANKMADKSRTKFALVRPCPLCGTMLERGQKVRTKVFTPSSTRRGKPITESMVHMFGCPFCDPRDNQSSDFKANIIPGPGIRSNPSRPHRICPVCSKQLGPEDIVVARMFEQDGKKPHLHVLGCNQCRKKSINF
jgi:heterodisulfide reductase subunit B